MQPSAIVRFDAKDVEKALLRLDVPQCVLQEAVQAGYVSRISRTANDARNAAGFYQWNETVRSLRDNMATRDWQRNDDGNWPTTVHPERKLAVAVASGDSNTGDEKAIPCTKTSKGPRTKAAVNRNANQLQLPLPGFKPPQSNYVAGPQYPTWLFLFYTDTKELRAELSLPVNMNSEGFVSEWSERIVLPAIPLDPVVIVSEPNFGPDVDIKIVRKG
jgi:hypothetical protein